MIKFWKKGMIQIVAAEMENLSSLTKIVLQLMVIVYKKSIRAIKYVRKINLLTAQRRREQRTLRQRERRENMSDEQRAIAKAKQAEYMRTKRAEVKASDPEKYEKNLARHRKYYEKTKEQRLAQQKEYRSNMSEEEKQQRLAQQKEYRNNMSEEEIENNRMKHTKYSRSKYREMRDAEEQLESPTLLTDEPDLQKMQRTANKRQQILAHTRNYKSRKWTNIEQVWDEDFPCR